MITVTADVAMLEKLRQAEGLAKIRDAEGNVVGFFAPVSVDRAPLYAQAAASISPAEVKDTLKGYPKGKELATDEHG